MFTLRASFKYSGVSSLATGRTDGVGSGDPAALESLAPPSWENDTLTHKFRPKFGFTFLLFLIEFCSVKIISDPKS